MNIPFFLCLTKAEIPVEFGQNHGETCGDTQNSTEYLSVGALNLEIYTLVSGPAACVSALPIVNHLVSVFDTQAKCQATFGPLCILCNDTLHSGNVHMAHPVY